MIFHIPPEDPPACPNCAALESEVARLTVDRDEERKHTDFYIRETHKMQNQRNDARALASGLAAAVRARDAALLDLRCQETPENARAWDAADVRVKDLLRRVGAGAGEAR